MRFKSFVLSSIGFLIFIVVGYFMISEPSVLKIWSPRIPYSADPLDYDALAHHICFRSIYSSLISDYKLGEIKGVVASRWSVSDDKTRWIFFIRNDLFFSNNDRITSKDVALSLTRAALKMKSLESNSGLLEHLMGYSTLQKANQNIDGISYDQDSVTLKFSKPMPDLLEKITFGLYAIISPKNYDEETGEWKNKKTIISSGPYEISSWTDTQLNIKLRDNYPKDLLLTKPIREAVYQFDQKNINNSDLIVDFDDSLAVDDKYKFFGPVKSGIRYIECEGWRNPDSICYERNTRINLRRIFYEKLEQAKFKVTKSFFPLAIKDIVEFSEEKTVNMNQLESKNYKRFKSIKVNPAFKTDANLSKLTPQEAYDLGINNISEVLKTPVDHLMPNPKAPLAEQVDFRFRMTAILVDSPLHDIVFMFKSKHGIKLPDQTGEINKVVSRDSFAPNEINRLLWDQAIIWPLGHMSLGVWKTGSKVKISSYNLILPPLDLQWIEWE